MKHVLKTFLVILAFVSVIYLLPQFSFRFDNKIISYKGLPSVSDFNFFNFAYDEFTFSKQYVYVFESVNNFDAPATWNEAASNDMNIISQRMYELLGNFYFLNIVKTKDNKIQIHIKSPIAIEQDIIVTKDTDNFDVLVKEITQSNTEESGNAETQKETTIEKSLNLSRSDFGPAKVTLDQNSQGYIIYLEPSLFISKEKLEILKNQQYQTLTVKHGTRGYSNARITSSNQFAVDFVPERLVITTTNNPLEAESIKTLFNTPSLSSEYKRISGKIYDQTTQTEIIKKISSLFIIFLIAIIYKLIRDRNNSFIKIIESIAIVVLTLAIAKLFVLPITIMDAIIIVFLGISHLFEIDKRHLIYTGIALITSIFVIVYTQTGIISGITNVIISYLIYLAINLYNQIQNYSLRS
ncbi:MAG: hypothetical protein N3A71_00595 [Candidatus Dojkabacteria bacterium]|nr:hypothetical protein [Candidatus Dojkabacteria bacterium]